MADSEEGYELYTGLAGNEGGHDDLRSSPVLERKPDENWQPRNSGEVLVVSGGFMAAAAGGLAIFTAMSGPSEQVNITKEQPAPIVQIMEP